MNNINNNRLIAKRVTILPTPPWELQKAQFDTEYSDKKTFYNSHELAALVREHIEKKYPSHLKIYTDGSILDDSSGGSAFIIPDLKVQKSSYIGKNKSIGIYCRVVCNNDGS